MNVSYAELIDNYFHQRAAKLDSITLEDQLVNANLQLHCLHRVGRVDELVDLLLREEMRPFEQTAFSQLEAMLYANIAVDRGASLVKLLRDCSSDQRIAHDTTLARVSNRLCLSFLDRFLLPAGSIDWEKLVRFTQHPGKQERREV